MYDHVCAELQKIRVIFNDSQTNFSHLFTRLHEDYSHRLADMIEKVAQIDEIRDLYERQVELGKEDMRRFDLKTERAVRDLEHEKNTLKSLIDMLRDDVDRKVRTVTALVSAQSDGLEEIKREATRTSLKVQYVQPLLINA